MCPNECPGLDEVWGEEFEKLYERYGTDTKVISFCYLQDVNFKTVNH